MKTGINETNDMHETVLLENPDKKARKSSNSLLDDEDLEVSSNRYNEEKEDLELFQEKTTKKPCWKMMKVDKLFNMLKFVAMGQHNTKFYRNKNSRYSSIFGGLLSLLLYFFIACMTMYSLYDLFTNSTYSMT